MCNCYICISAKIIQYNWRKYRDSYINIEKYKLIDVSMINNLPNKYPDEFEKFCLRYEIKPPKITSFNGKALSVMLKYRFFYWNRETCDIFVKKFNIKTKDSIQLFNKHSQFGIKTNSGMVKNKLFIVYPYKISNKFKTRKNFDINITKEQKYKEIDKIKSTIKNDYIDVSNKMWQFGHKNPNIELENNVVLQPPIQSKYRDNYIFIDTLTKIPLPLKLKDMIKKKEIQLTPEQIKDYSSLFNNLLKQIS